MNPTPPTRSAPGLEFFGGTDNAWTQAVWAACPSLRTGFAPPRWARSRHAQTLLFMARGRLAVEVDWDAEQSVTMDDGGTVSVQWLGLDAPAATPVVVVLPTITGCGDDLRRVVASLREQTGGWVVAVCNRRGHGGLPLTAPRFNTMGSTADLDRQLDVIEQYRPEAPLFGVGISAGSGLLVRYLGETGSRSRLNAGIAHCPGYDISRAFRRVHPLYDRVMTRTLVDFFIRRHPEVWAGVTGVEACASSRSLGDFHDRLYPLAGYTSTQTYYEGSNPMVVADGIEVPLLVVNAADDPVCALSNVHGHMRQMQALPQLTLVLAKRGGHCGFFDGALASHCWADRLLGEYLRAAHEATSP